MIIRDDVLTNFDELRTYADTAPFRNYQNGPDGIVYPLICTEIPIPVDTQMRNLVESATGERPSQSTIFMRASPKGVYAPHQAHSDEVMGRWSVMIYMNRSEDCQGGTSLVRHKATGMDRSPQTPDLTEAWQRDTNDPDAWDVVAMAEMRPNRGCVFDSELMHRAEPVGGFGSTQQDARLVLTGFFS